MQHDSPEEELPWLAQAIADHDGLRLATIDYGLVMVEEARGSICGHETGDFVLKLWKAVCADKRWWRYRSMEEEVAGVKLLYRRFTVKPGAGPDAWRSFYPWSMMVDTGEEKLISWVQADLTENPLSDSVDHMSIWASSRESYEHLTVLMNLLLP